MEQLGRPLIVVGLVLVVIGILLAFGEKLPFRLGRLPLDFRFERGNLSVYILLGTSILLGIVISLIFTLVNRR